MSLKRTTIIFVGGVALAAWFSAAMTPGRAPAASRGIRPAPIDAKGAMLSGEIARLRERLRPDAVPRKASRNPFVFRSSLSSLSSLSSKPRAESGSSGGTAAAVAPLAKDASAALLDEPRLRLSLAGVAEDPDPAGGAPVRTAIIAANGQVFLVKEGGMVTDRGVEDVQYQVRTISAESAELVDPRDNTVHRLALK